MNIGFGWFSVNEPPYRTTAFSGVPVVAGHEAALKKLKGSACAPKVNSKPRAAIEKGLRKARRITSSCGVMPMRVIGLLKLDEPKCGLSQHALCLSPRRYLAGLQ